MEWLLYRLGLSEQTSGFILKGAMLFVVWTSTACRATKDLDLLARKSATTVELQSFFRSLCVMKVEDDGLVFLADSVQAAAIREDNLYQGVRVTLEAQLAASARAWPSRTKGCGKTKDFKKPRSLRISCWDTL